MLRNLGVAGTLGVLLLLGGLGVVVWAASLELAAGLAAIIAGLGLIVYGLVKNLLSSLGLGALT